MSSTNFPMDLQPNAIDDLAAAKAAGDAVGAETSVSFEALCNRIHEIVQSTLDELTKHVSFRQPRSQSRPGRSSSRKTFPWFFSYRVFSLPDVPENDPVVAGVSVDCREDRVAIRGDISRENSGETLFDGGLVEISSREISKAPALAGQAAEQLAGQVDLVVQSLDPRGNGPSCD